MPARHPAAVARRHLPHRWMSGEAIDMGTTVEDVMTARVISVPESAGYKEIITLLRRYRVSAVPVVDPSGRVTGIVSEADLIVKQTAPALPTGSVRLAWRLRNSRRPPR
jgi:CBS-domain-containing membrane protein